MKRKIRLRNHIAWSIALLCVILTGSIGGIGLYNSNKLIKEQAVERLKNEAVLQATRLENKMKRNEDLVVSAEALLQNTFDTKQLNLQYVKNYKERYKQLYKSILEKSELMDLWLYFNPDLFEGFNSISHRLVNDKYQLVQDGFELEYSNTDPEMEWYFKAVEKGEHWSKPYYWKRWDMELVSYSKLVYVDSVLVGIMGTDFEFSSFRKSFESFSIYKDDYLILGNENNDLIIHPHFEGENVKTNLDNESFKSISSAMSSKPSGWVQYELGGVKKFLAYSKLSNGWFVALAPTYSEVYAGSIFIRNVSLVLIVLGIILSTIYAWHFGRRISKPIQGLIKLWQKADRGLLNELNQDFTTYEFNELARNYNEMASHQNSLIEEIQAASEELSRTNLELERKDQLKNDFLMNLSHEIRTPMNTISGYANLISQDNVGEEDWKYFTKEIKEKSEYLTHLIEDTLKISMLKSGQYYFKKRTFLVSDIESSLRQKFLFMKTKDIQLVFNFERKLSLFSDPNAINEVFDYLFNNAYKYTERGKIELGMYKKDDEEYVFYVKDSGIGINPEKQEDIFEAYFQEDYFEKGLGYGLAICREIVGLLEGQIWVESKPAEGACFYFSVRSLMPVELA